MVTHSVDVDPGWIPSLPLPKKWHRAALCFSASRRGPLPWVFHPPGRSTDGIFPVGSPYQSLSRASCHLKVSADSGVELSVWWSRGQTRGLLQFSYKQQVLLMFIPVSAAEVGVLLKWFCSVSSPCWDSGFNSSPGQTQLRRDDLSFYRMAWKGEEDGGMLLLSHLPCSKPVHALVLAIPEVAIL